MKRALTLLLAALLAAGLIAWWLTSGPPPEAESPSATARIQDTAQPGAPATPSARPSKRLGEADAEPDDVSEDEPATETAAQALRARCAPPRPDLTLSSELIELVENVLTQPLAEDSAGAEAQMAECLALRDAVDGHGLSVYGRDDGGELARVRQAIAQCWERWYTRPDADEQQERVSRRQAMEGVLGRATPLVRGQDHEGLLEMTDELSAMDAPMTVYDDWDPAVDLPWVLALRADAPVEHFEALLERGSEPSPRALSRLATHGRVDVLSALAAAGVDLDTSDMAGNGIVHGAVMSGDAEVVREIAELGVDFDRRNMHPRPQLWPYLGDNDAEIGEVDGLNELLQQKPQLAAAIIRAGYTVGPEHLDDLLQYAPKDVADEAYLALRAQGCG